MGVAGKVAKAAAAPVWYGNKWLVKHGGKVVGKELGLGGGQPDPVSVPSPGLHLAPPDVTDEAIRAMARAMRSRGGSRQSSFLPPAGGYGRTRG